MKSPFTISYQDLIKEQEQTLSHMRSKFPVLVKSGQMNDWVAKRKITIQERLVKMLKTHQKNRQLNLNEIFENR